MHTPIILLLALQLFSGCLVYPRRPRTNVIPSPPAGIARNCQETSLEYNGERTYSHCHVKMLTAGFAQLHALTNIFTKWRYTRRMPEEAVFMGAIPFIWILVYLAHNFDGIHGNVNFLFRIFMQATPTHPRRRICMHRCIIEQWNIEDLDCWNGLWKGHAEALNLPTALVTDTFLVSGWITLVRDMYVHEWQITRRLSI